MILVTPNFNYISIVNYKDEFYLIRYCLNEFLLLKVKHTISYTYKIVLTPDSPLPQKGSVSICSLYIIVLKQTDKQSFITETIFTFYLINYKNS